MSISRKQNRRQFLRNTALTAGMATFAAPFVSILPAMSAEAAAGVGQPLPAWKPGNMDVHYIYTGVGENMFLIFPDGTTMVLDASDRPSAVEEFIPILPDKSKLPSQWIAQYIKRVMPSNAQGKIDYMMLSHYHEDHGGSSRLHAGKTTGRGEEYYLSGLANLGEIFQFDTVYDRGYPNYAYISKSGADGYDNFYRFSTWKAQQKQFKLEEFLVGQRDQITLRKDRAAWPDFHIRNISANGVVWTGTEGKNVDLVKEFPAKHHIPENPLSLAMTIDYGPFRYFTGGDITNVVLKKQDKVIPFEETAGRAAGIVDVCKANHHSFKDSMSPGFVAAVQARVYISNVWNKSHLQDNTMQSMTDRTLYPNPRMICPTWAAKQQMELYKDAPWQADLKPAAGHVVLRVSDAGRQYQIYHLTAADESMKVKAVFGPFRSKKAS
ncbi:MAG: twin-arginine translocation signal domain-containing protein [Thermoguttaceae bacterium]|nr:twin-arginine translocation signal domain-containing protein [Thermoguttaceae bacterium]